MRAPGALPSGLVWSKKSRAAMSSEWARAAVSSWESPVTAPQPALARSWLTRARTWATSPWGTGGWVWVAGALCVGRGWCAGAEGVLLLGAAGLLAVLGLLEGE